MPMLQSKIRLSKGIGIADGNLAYDHIRMDINFEMGRDEEMRKLLLVLLAAVLFTGCKVDRPVDTGAVVRAMAAAADAPAGQIYLYDLLASGSDAGVLSAMPDSLIASAFGNGTSPSEFACLEAYAVWLCSFARPMEYGCFIVARERDAEAVAAMCLRRLETISRLCGEDVIAEPPLIIGRCVFYAFGEGAGAALSAAREMMQIQSVP